MRTQLGPYTCVRNAKASIFKGLPVEFLVGVATCTRALNTWQCFWSSDLLCVVKKAPKALLVTSYYMCIDIN